MGLSTFIRSEQEVRRLFGKKELEIIQRQLKGMPLTQSEQNRLSRDIKPKFACIEELSNFKEEFNLAKNQENKRLMQKAIEIMLQDKEKDNIKAILLFGSFADNTQIFRSDIDICAVFKNQPTLREATEFRIRVSGQLPEKLDIQVFNTLPQKIKREIAKNHKVLYKQKDYNNVDFSIQYLKEDDYFIRMKRIFLEKK
ncbi:MAG TPA: nucleotidyltransferase domain-containing protein [Candidatus Nanoarchaeia archaeon]|nr:nucleotidyltransferase domain-containing protein [Candidatus Nanoarchaeia archaeon]